MKVIIVAAVVALCYTLSTVSKIFFKSLDTGSINHAPKSRFQIRPRYKPGGSGEEIPRIPGVNSDYVEGKTRYFWMPNGEEVPVLVDLEEPVDENLLVSLRSKDINHYWLYTRKNPNNSQIIVFDNPDTIWNSNFDASRPLKVIVHGWKSSGTSEINRLVVPAFLSVLDANVIVVDWSTLAESNYITAANGVPTAGEYMGNFLIWLMDTTGSDWNKVHLVGFSLGAHFVGSAGRTASNRAARVTGLDPAGPLWVGHSEALIASDGQYVESIHTDGGILGLFGRISQSDFYPNGGTTPQPGCSIFSTCSHSRSYHLFASTVRTDHLIGSWCTDLEAAQAVDCDGAKLHMGNAVLDKKGEGIYALTTGSEWPF